MSERKTVVRTDAESLADRLKQKVEFSGEKNVLNSYRSATYNFTLAAMRKSLVDKPEEIRERGLDLVILRSGGKGNTKLSTSSSLDSTQQKEIQKKTLSRYSDLPLVDQSKVNEEIDQTMNSLLTSNNNLVEGFNKDSPGRFDMFIDNVEIKTLMAFSEIGNVTLPTNIKFEVFEPYSVNGFIEALHVSSLAAGYPSYLQASFILKVEFIGYPDSKELPTPESVPDSTRYFPFVFTGVDVDITERGTRYVCSAVPVEQRVFGSANVLKKSLNGEGKKVKDILKDLLDKFTASLKNSEEEAKKFPGPGDKYLIKFPKLDPETGFDYLNGDNDIADADFAEINSDSVLFKLNAPEQSQIKNDSVKQTTTAQRKDEFKIQFPENINLSDAIISIVRDSTYVRKLIKNIKPDAYGFVDYFSLRTEIKNLDTVNQITGKPYQEISYIVAPYKVHYTRIPGLGNTLSNEAELKRQSLREYNYIYTGLNVDIINFKLNFNTLYFEAVPIDMGNFDQGALKNTPVRTGTADLELSKSNQTDAETARLGRQGSVVKQQVNADPAYTSTKDRDSVTAGQPISEYAAMAKAIHNSIINSKASMITGEVEILGDPFYLVTGGMGSYNPKPMKNKLGQVGLGEAPYTQREVLININFKNPVDFNSLEQGGLIKFDALRVPFSGVFQVTEALSIFRNGEFKQRLNILRIPGQVVDVKIRSQDPAREVVTSENPELQPIPDTSRSNAPEQRLTDSAALSSIGRGTPITGLPGQLSNFTAASGGLGGNAEPLLNQTFGFAANPLAAGPVVVGRPLPTDFLSSVRLSASGLADLSQTNLGSAAVINAAANVLTGNLSSQRIAGILAQSIASNAVAPVLSRSADNILGQPSNPANLVTSIGNNALDAASNLGSRASTLINDVGNKVSNLLDTVADPGSVAAKVGLDSSKISGLATNLQSKLTQQISDFAKNIPENVSLNKALENGLAFEFLSPSSVKNIPATAPNLTAPEVEINTEYLNQVAARGGARAIEDLYGVTDLTQLSSSVVPENIISDSLSSVPDYQQRVLNKIPFSSNSIDINVINDKVETARSQLSNLTNQIKVNDLDADKSVSTVFGSISKQSPLTKLINNLSNKT